MDADDAATDQGPGSALPGPFRIGFVPGVVVGKWTRTWAERFGDRPIEVIRTEQADQCAALLDGRLDACFVRFPLERDGLSVIPLYKEVAVALLPADHPLTEDDPEEVSVLDLVDEDLLQDPDAVPQWRDAAAELRTAAPAPAPRTASPADAVALVAAGLGVLILPMSVARIYRRRDVTALPIADVDGTEVALAWASDRTSDDVERLIGIVRGRTVNSSRGAAGVKTPETGRKPAARSGQPGRPRGRKTPNPRRRGSR